MLRHRIALLLSACSLAAQTELYRYDTYVDGTTYLGDQVCAAGDTDGDGVGDFLVSAFAEDTKGAARLYSGATGELSFTFLGESVFSHFGFSVAGLGDVDGDGLADVAVGARWDDGVWMQDAGAVYVYSGADGSLILKLVGEADKIYFGSSVAGIGDADGDGVPDLAVGATRDSSTLIHAGSVRLISMATGTELFRWYGDFAGDELGRSVAGPGDLDGDGIPDVLGGSPVADLAGQDAGLVRAWSGATGALLGEIVGDSPFYNLGNALAGLDDVDGDGTPDLAVGTQGSNVARVYSGATGAIVHEFTGEPPSCLPITCYENFGWSVGNAGDVDADGVGDVLVGSSPNDVVLDLAGYARIYSGATGALLVELHGTEADEGFGTGVAGLGDLNGDSVPEVLIGAPYTKAPSTGGNGGSARVYSTSAAAFAAKPVQLSLSAGGAQALSLDAGRAQAGRPYWIGGSLSGITPGLDLGPVHVPLVPDVYATLTLTSPGATPLVGAIGLLDGSGKAAAAFAIPPGSSPALVGLAAHHAFVALDLTAPAVAFASNAAPVVLLP